VLFVNPREKLKTKNEIINFLYVTQSRGKGGHIGFWIDLKVTTLGCDLERNMCGKFGVTSLLLFLRWSSICISHLEARAAILDFGSTYIVTTFTRDLIKNICGKSGVNPFSCSWEEVENVSANQRPRQTYLILDPLKK